MWKNLVLIVLAFGIAGCASVPMESAENDAKAKQFQVSDEGKAGVYIYRNETFGAAMKLSVALDGKHLGQTASKTYFYKEVEPGEHSVMSSAENTDELTFEAIAGKLYYVWQEIKMGVMAARSKLHLVDEEQGQKGVNESKLAISQ